MVPFGTKCTQWRKQINNNTENNTNWIQNVLGPGETSVDLSFMQTCLSRHSVTVLKGAAGELILSTKD